MIFHYWTPFLDISVSKLKSYFIYIDCMQVMMKEGVLSPLVGSLMENELNCQRYSALCIANLATTVAAQVKIVQAGAVTPLINLALNIDSQIEGRRYAVLAIASKFMPMTHSSYKSL
jgi:hypothetical protein